MDNRRDFIDFLCLILERKVQFFILIIVFGLIGFYYDYNKNSVYKFDINIHVAQKDVFYNTDSFQTMVFLSSIPRIKEGTNGSAVSYEYVKNSLWSRPQLREFLENINTNSDFISNITDEFIKTNKRYKDKRSEINREITSSIEFKSNSPFSSDFVFIFNNKELGYFIYNNFSEQLSLYLNNRIKNHMLNLKKSFDANIDNKLKTELNVPDISNTKFINYFSSSFNSSKRLHSTILYFILIIFSFFIHVMLSILYDLNLQVKERANK